MYCNGVCRYIVIYLDRGDLQKYITEMKKQQKKIPEKNIWRMMADILVALNNLHLKGILHRDIKSANIFISTNSYVQQNEGEIYKLGDLNVSKVNKGSLAYTQTGTPYYASPEVWRDEPYDHKSDIWSFGCIVYEMASLFFLDILVVTSSSVQSYLMVISTHYFVTLPVMDYPQHWEQLSQPNSFSR